MIELIKRTLPYIKVAFFFPLCWVIGGTIVATILLKFDVANSWAFFAYFAVGVAGTVWFARS